MIKRQIQMRRTLSFILSLLMIVSLVVPVMASSKSQTLLDEEGTLEKRTIYSFYLKNKAECLLDFSAEDGLSEQLNSELIEGDSVMFMVEIRDSNSNTVFSKEFRDKVLNKWFFAYGKFSFTLQKGKYKLIITPDKKYVASDCSCVLKATYLEDEVIILAQGQKHQLSAYSALRGKKISWSDFYSIKSSNKRIASVDEDGLVTAKALGKADIKGEYWDGDTLCFEDFEAKVVVNSVNVTMYLGESKSLNYLIKNISGYDSAKWSSNNKSVVSVTKSGKATVKNNGKATLTVKIDGQKYKVNVNVPKVELNKTSMSMVVGKSFRLLLSAPDNKTTWSSSNPKVASVSSNGTVTAKQPGSATITATFEGVNYSCKVSVKKVGYGTVSGTVIAEYKKHGEYDWYPDTGARVYIIDPLDNTILGKAMVNADGNYTIPRVLAGKWVILFVSNHNERYDGKKVTVYGISTYYKYWKENIVVSANQTTICDNEFIS